MPLQKVLNCGFCYLDKNGRQCPILAADGSVPKYPVLLDENGAILPRGRDPVYLLIDENMVHLGFARNAAGEGFTPAVPYWMN